MECSSGKSANQEVTNQKEPAGFHEEVVANAANNAVLALVEKKIMYQLSFTPKGEDPAFWPISVLSEINYLIVNRKNTKDRQYAAVGEILSPLSETFRKVTTAFEIIAYPQQQDWARRINIQADIEGDRQLYGRDQVELNDTELAMLVKFASARGLPFKPEKRIYSYSEVPCHVNPWGKRHLTTEEIRKELSEEHTKPKK